MTRKPKRIGEPVQVYLSDRDRELLDKAAKDADMPRSEIIRVAIRRYVAELPPQAGEAPAFDYLIGSLDGYPEMPSDLAENHDKYLYGEPPKRTRRKR